MTKPNNPISSLLNPHNQNDLNTRRERNWTEAQARVQVIGATVSIENDSHHHSPIHFMALRLIYGASICARVMQRLLPRRGRIFHLSKVEGAAKEMSLVSLDFFDTLAIRQASSPFRVLRKSAELSTNLIADTLGIQITPFDFYRQRLLVERQLARERSAFWKDDEESTLASIMRHLLKRMGVFDEDLMHQLIEVEFNLELDCLSLNTGAQMLLERLHSKNKTLVVVSDMYLTAEQLRRMCHRLGIDQYLSRFYVSGDLALSKKSSRLFSLVLKEEKCDAKQAIHIGDKLLQDYKMPRSLGIKSLWLPSKNEPIAIAESLQINGQKAISNIDRLVDSYVTSRCNGKDALRRAFLTGISPGFYAMAYKSLRDCRRMGVDRLYFLARDAVPMKPIYDLLLTQHPEFHGYTPRTLVLFCSRASTVCCRLTGNDDEETIVRTVLERFSSLSYSNLFSAWNIDPSEITSIDSNYTNQISVLDLVERLKNDTVFRKEFEDAVLRQQQLLFDYLIQENATEGVVAFVDVGWGGTIQQNIQNLLISKGISQSIIGLYMGTDQRLGLNSCKGYLFSESDYRSQSIFRAASVTETLLACRNLGTTVGYERENLRVTPIFREPVGHQAEIELARKWAFENYFELFLQLTRAHDFLEPELMEQGRRSYFKIITNPSKAFVKAIEELEFQFDWGYEDSRKLVAKATVSDYLLPTRLIGLFWRNPWVFGSLKANHLGFLNRPLTWLLGIDQKISRKIFDLCKRLIGGRKLPHRVV